MLGGKRIKQRTITEVELTDDNVRLVGDISDV